MEPAKGLDSKAISNRIECVFTFVIEYKRELTNEMFHHSFYTIFEIQRNQYFAIGVRLKLIVASKLFTKFLVIIQFTVASYDYLAALRGDGLFPISQPHN